MDIPFPRPLYLPSVFHPLLEAVLVRSLSKTFCDAPTNQKTAKFSQKSLLTTSTYYTACTMCFSIQHLNEKKPHTSHYSGFEYRKCRISSFHYAAAEVARNTCVASSLCAPVIILRESIIGVINKIQLSLTNLAAHTRSVSIPVCDTLPPHYLSWSFPLLEQTCRL